ncbi:hypothetical protein BCR33DRAFT_392909 [Rhizoclosmatium globosum]|uniref:Uncharacterized protein n=1 Tax=Rhizoclosmatium globosum TaxID=329046 RepID=A0A1Y2BXZ5_9FUNG|nr:hypothetical protein BCR33DRAFT_392909 [Rhizoclosmatium globosum]|eukprot:ORY39633.1 hypothetical protein BCR33DRAFT_392909 [Rhizoclosmatium globosum]
MIYKPLTDEQLLTANAFFLSGPQRKLQKMLQDQAKLMKEIQESQAISAEFSKGKSANPFLQPRLFTATTSSCSTISELKGQTNTLGPLQLKHHGLNTHILLSFFLNHIFYPPPTFQLRLN